ncbi:hypothetical protein EGW08_002477 [Elysia chlorotica]|uniref:Uncharacterized protein n=1 Tax=Elysia chlorotica TaxID=188477 RepID=A0A3S1AEH9_ELYCH|nr:hypothetical protein EGW08_002477 [Elysia chlorotica]
MFVQSLTGLFNVLWEKRSHTPDVPSRLLTVEPGSTHRPEPERAQVVYTLDFVLGQLSSSPSTPGVKIRLMLCLWKSVYDACGRGLRYACGRDFWHVCGKAYIIPVTVLDRGRNLQHVIMWAELVAYLEGLKALTGHVPYRFDISPSVMSVCKLLRVTGPTTDTANSGLKTMNPLTNKEHRLVVMVSANAAIFIVLHTARGTAVYPNPGH